MRLRHDGLGRTIDGPDHPDSLAVLRRTGWVPEDEVIDLTEVGDPPPEPPREGVSREARRKSKTDDRSPGDTGASSRQED